MVKQQALTGEPKQLQLPLWKRLTLVTALLLSGESLVVVVSSQAAHASSVTYIMCKAGDGGHGGLAINTIDGGRGGTGGECLIYGAKGGDGGTSSGHGDGGNVSFHP